MTDTHVSRPNTVHSDFHLPLQSGSVMAVSVDTIRLITLQNSLSASTCSSTNTGTEISGFGNNSSAAGLAFHVNLSDNTDNVARAETC
jgi:hypothetical protein